MRALTIDDLRKKHGESYTLMKMMNGMRYAYAMATAGSRIDVMRERALQMEVEVHGIEHELSLLDAWIKVDRSMQPLKEQWADGIACGATSAAWMLLVYKIVRRPGAGSLEHAKYRRVAETLGSRHSEDGGESTEQLESAGALQA